MRGADKKFASISDDRLRGQTRLAASFAVMIGEFFLVLFDLPIELVGQRVDRGVQIDCSGIGVDGLVGSAVQ